MEPLLKMIIFIVAITLFSVLWGKVILFNASKKYLKSVSMYLMKYIRWPHQQLHAMLLGFFYYGTCIIGSILFLTIYRVNIFKYFLIKPEYLLYIIVAIFAQISVSNMIMSIVVASSNRVDWVGEIRRIPWINSISFMPEKFGPFVPVLGAFFEELFFRGVVFFIFLEVFPEAGLVLPIAISAILFSIQQMLNTETRPQAITMAIASVSISIIGCLSIVYTNSFLPALIAHESFVIFYFSQMGFQYNQR